MRRQWTAEEGTIADEMAATGLSSYQIAARLNRPRSSITSALSRRGIRLPHKGGADRARIEAIRELAAPAELSARQIGERLGITRNAVIGIARRHGIQLRAPQPARVRTAESRPRPRKPWAPQKKREDAVELDAYQPPALICEAVPDDLDASEPVAFMDLGAGQCRWIEGQPNGLDTLYCGRRVLHGKSWCRDHFVRAFDLAATKASIRKSRRRAA